MPVNEVRVSVRLPREVYEFIERYARVQGITKSQAMREILHMFKWIVITRNGFYPLYVIKESGLYNIDLGNDSVRVNLYISRLDDAFLREVSKILGVKKSVALRICLSTAMKLFKALGLII